MSRGRVVTVHLGTRCCEHDPLCPCRGELDPREAARRLRAGGEVLVLRGAPRGPDALAETIRVARRTGFSRIVLAARADRLADPDHARAVAAAGVDVLRAPLHAHVAPVHDRIAGAEGALVRSLVGLRAAAAAGIAVEVETHLLPLRLTTPCDVLELAHRAVPSLRAIRFVHAPRVLPPALAPPPWSAMSAPLAEALDRAAELGVDAPLDAAQGIPPCALSDHPEHLARFRLDRARARRTPALVCRTCAVAARCGGPVPSYGGEVAPFEEVPRALDARRARGARPRWDAASREAARDVRFLVLRPTVHCNQDCVFCSANESSGQVWSDPDRMVRAIARAASRGLRRLSFSGGEPTLSPHLPSFVEVARRCGVPEIEIVTNGVLLDREARVDALVRAGLTHAFVSLHAHDEALSRALTLKNGDHARTLRAIELLDRRGVRTVINHVITSRSAPFLERFVELVRERFGGRVLVSLAMVSPQFKSLERPELTPRLSEAAPLVRRALRRAIELEQPIVVGARQGVPPCFLGPFRAWSDALGVVAEAASEDAPQKRHGAACARCRYREVCPGLWRPYLDRHGDGELAPIEGEPFTAAELDAIAAHAQRPPWGVPMRFEDAPDPLRDRALEGAIDDAPAPPRVHLPIAAGARSRPLRVLLVGSGARARLVAHAAADLHGLTIEAVASPHSTDAHLPELDRVPRHASLHAALDAMRPEAAIVAASTAAHHALALALLEAGVPLLIEKPLARTLEEAEEIVRAAARAGVVAAPMHQDVVAPGVRDVLSATGALRWLRRCAPGSADLPRAWSRAALFESLHHPIAAVVRAADGADASVVSASWSGGGAPERIRLELRAGGLDAEVVLERARVDDLRVARADGTTFVRTAARAELHRPDGNTERTPGAALVSLLDAFRGAVLGEPAPSLPPLADALAALRATRDAIDALDRAGAPFDRAGAPRHASSPDLRDPRPRR